MITTHDFADRTPTQQEMKAALQKAHVLRSQEFRAAAWAVVSFFKGLAPSGSAGLAHGRIA